jgi:uncharacterized damage-inducible protein DinB
MPVMPLQQNFMLMATYNQWMNDNLYDVSSQLTAHQLIEDRGAFFGSVLGTLNHILVGDTIWLQRFSCHPSDFTALKPLRSQPVPKALSQILHADVSALRDARGVMDRTIIDFVAETTETDYSQALTYADTRGNPHRKNFGQLLQHFFNHQTHHRGQVTVLLSQQGLDFGVTDLLLKIEDIV